MNRTLRHLHKRAALEIGRTARELRRAHTVGGKFTERDVQLEYFRLVALRRELYEAAK